jgi:hypothetical protein
LVVAGLGLLAACRSSTPARPAAVVEDMWSLAPPGTYLAVAIRHGESYDLLAAAERLLEGAPGATGALAFIKGKLDYEHVQMRSAAARRGSGIDDAGPVVDFYTKRGGVHLYRIADRKAYDRTFRVVPDRSSRGRLTIDRDGTHCFAKSGYQVCGRRELLLEILDGQGMRVPWLDSGAKSTAKIWLAPSAIGPLAGFTSGGEGIRIELDIGGGRLVARAHLTGQVEGQLASLGVERPSPLASALPRAGLSGAAVINLVRWVDSVRAQAIENVADKPAIGPLSQADLWTAVRGDASVWSTAASVRLTIGLERADVIRRLVARCEELAPPLPGLRVSREGEVCRIRHDELVKFGVGDVLVRVTDDALIAESGAPPARAASGREHPMLARIRRGEEGLAMWGSGLLVSLLDDQPLKDLEGYAALSIWLWLHVDETSGTVRVDPDGIRGELQLGTIWDYDQASLAQIEPVLRRIVEGDAGAAREVSGLAGKHPMLAADLAHGRQGVLVPLLSGVFVGATARELFKSLAGAIAAGAEVVEAYEKVVELGCRCKDAECAERAVERFQKWEATHGEVEVDNASLARIGELTEEWNRCIGPFYPDDPAVAD